HPERFQQTDPSVHGPRLSAQPQRAVDRGSQGLPDAWTARLRFPGCKCQAIAGDPGAAAPQRSGGVRLHVDASTLSEAIDVGGTRPAVPVPRSAAAPAALVGRALRKAASLDAG